MMDKETILKNYVEKWKNLPPQGSDRWLKDRKFTIGGSEMGVITKNSPFKTIRALIEQHLGITCFKGNLNTYWGSILEDVTVRILEKMWGYKIYELGSLPGVVKGQKYSPDGLFYASWIDKIILVEIKNAIRRSATGKIPHHYAPQIHTGLATIGISDFAIFVDSMFRKCHMRDFKFTPSFDTNIHPPRSKIGVPLALMFMGLYMTPEQEERDVNGDWKIFSRRTLGKDCSKEEMDVMFKAVLCKNISVHLSDVVSEEEKGGIEKEIKKYERMVESKRLVKIAKVPLKLFRFKITPSYRQPYELPEDVNEPSDAEELKGKTYVHRYEKTIRFVIDTIKELDPLEEKEQISRLDEIFEDEMDDKKVPPGITNSLIASMMEGEEFEKERPVNKSTKKTFKGAPKRITDSLIASMMNDN